ncbi:MoaD/ThiS family protein [Reichenbachiella versicolor]|uniref:MoaD/ThiS family protein n=1 Tax=Reichenbachiella versicolor TaxID=1821036 RepID=UPI000D6E5F75|nr:MoaD/ThiS family protein [Reichenbachiella versicolor]
MANIIIPTPLRKFTGNETIVKVEGDTVKASIDQLVSKFPDLNKHILDADGNIRKFIKVYVGDEDISTLNNENTVVKDDTTIGIIPAIAGGKK